MEDQGFSIAHIAGKSIILATAQFGIVSFEMSPQILIYKEVVDQKTFQEVISSLKEYIKISIAWTIGVMLYMYSDHGIKGAIAAAIANLIVIAWIINVYIRLFRKIASDKNLKVPNVFL